MVGTSLRKQMAKLPEARVLMLADRAKSITVVRHAGEMGHVTRYKEVRAKVYTEPTVDTQGPRQTTSGDKRARTRGLPRPRRALRQRPAVPQPGPYVQQGHPDNVRQDRQQAASQGPGGGGGTSWDQGGDNGTQAPDAGSGTTADPDVWTTTDTSTTAPARPTSTIAPPSSTERV